MSWPCASVLFGAVDMAHSIKGLRVSLGLLTLDGVDYGRGQNPTLGCVDIQIDSAERHPRDYQGSIAEGGRIVR